MELIVTGCGDCCFKGHDIIGYYECKHPNGQRVIVKKENKPDGVFITPEDCPLNKEPIVIHKVGSEEEYVDMVIRIKGEISNQKQST